MLASSTKQRLQQKRRNVNLVTVDFLGNVLWRSRYGKQQSLVEMIKASNFAIIEKSLLPDEAKRRSDGPSMPGREQERQDEPQHQEHDAGSATKMLDHAHDHHYVARHFLRPEQLFPFGRRAFHLDPARMYFPGTNHLPPPPPFTHLN
ncbi:unnamed protein product [Amoebophrya sp. A120]|nr:unnamed protein product [Amoebophrya sp. A120]|eukprot:GSA120T00008115001.1